MTDEPTLPLPSPEVIASIFEALEDGVPAEIESLAAVVPAAETEIRTALQAVLAYRAEVEQARTGSRIEAMPGDGELQPGSEIGDFVIEERIGAGAMGIVYRARQVSLGNREVALKVLPPSLAARDPRFIERFEREAKLAATIHHPNLAEVYGIETTGDVLCFAMRLIRGRTLQDILLELAQRHAGPVRETDPEHVRACGLIARAVADALAEVHARGLVHRDVKPSNIILEGAGEDLDQALGCRPVLVDFGLLRPVGETELTGTKTLLGTAAYASHETRLGRDIDARADVFSLGAVLHDLLTVTSPDTRGVATSGLGDARAINPAVDRGLAAIVDMALQERRELRYVNGGAIREDLDRWLRNEPVAALPTGAFARWRLWSKRNPTGAARAMVLSTVAVVLVALSTWAIGWVWDTSALASRAERHEADGNLPAAAQAYRELADTAGAGWIPWLWGALDRAPLYAEGTNEHLCLAIQHYRDGESALKGNAASRAAAKHDFARAADRLRNVLFGPDEPILGDAARMALLREARDGVPEYRQRIAVDAWASYLWLLLEHRPYPPALPTVLRQHLASEDTSSATRQAAVSALAAIPTHEALRDVLELQVDEDVDVATLARNCAAMAYSWLHRYRADSEHRQIDPAFMARWAELRDTLYRRLAAGSPEHPDVLGGSYNPSICWRLACYERRGEGPPLPAWRIPAPAPIRVFIDRAHDEIARFLRTNPDLDDDSEDAFGNTPLANYRYASGRAVLHHDATIWQPPAGSLDPISLLTRTPDADDRHGLLDFWSQPIDQPPAAAGTVISARYTAAERLPDTRTTPAPATYHLRMLQPGYSSLQVSTAVPRTAGFLTVRLFHTLGTRNQLRGGGQATCRLSVVGETCSVTTGVALGSGTVLLSVGSDILNRHDVLEIQCDYLHGDTSYWIRRIELEWGEDPYGDRNIR